MHRNLTALAALTASSFLVPMAYSGNTAYRNTILADSPLAYWEFEETTGTVAADSATGNGAQNGAFENCTLNQTGGLANLGACASFNGSSSRVRIPASSVFELGTGDFTVEAWYNTPSTSRGDIFNYKNVNDFGLFANANGAGSIGGYHNAFLPSYNTTTSAWHHLVVTRTGSTARLYVDGLDRGSAIDANSFSATADMFIGANHTGAPGYSITIPFNGRIDEVAVYATALSATRIAAHYGAASQTPGAATVINTPAASITFSSAMVGGQVTDSGTGGTPAITLFWGTSDGATTAANWGNSVALGAQSGVFSTNLSALNPATNYYFRCRATNTAGENWASSTAAFLTSVGPPVVQNGTASSILATSATLSATVAASGGENPVVTIFYGAIDGGTNAASWAGSVSLGAQAGTAAAVVNGLLPGTLYFFRARAQNSGGTGWDASSGTFTTSAASPPGVDNSGAGAVTAISAVLRGTITVTGNDPPTVKIYYGPTDGGSIPAAWANVVSLSGTQTSTFESLIAGLTPQSTYFFRCFAQNAAGAVWAASSQNFSTPAATIPPVVINEIHYHPVEEAAFDANGNPTLDLTEDVHEFVEIYNSGIVAVDLSNWILSGGVDFTFPSGTFIPGGGFRVIAKDPARLQTAYSISGVLGPYSGNLGNRSDGVKLKNASGTIVDAVNYSAAFPWPSSADALGADQDFTLISKSTFQYKGRSLQRFSPVGGSNDPANWLASPLASGPSPGAVNALVGTTPKPVVVALSVSQAADDSPIIRAAQQVRLTFSVSSASGLSSVEVQYWLDDVNSFSETRSSVAAASLGNGVWQASIPGQPDRSIVRWRIRADRGSGIEPVSPRSDDAAIVPVGATTREAWHSYFVQPLRSSPNPVYDVFVSTDNSTNYVAFNGLNGLQAMNFNISQSPKRVTSAANTGLPREIPYVAATAAQWNGSVPCIFIDNGIVRDAHLRYHGSRYNRNAGRNSFKLRFADYQKFRGADSVFITDKSDYFSVMQGLFINASLPMSEVRWVDWYLNTNAKLIRLEQGEYNGDLLDIFHKRMKDKNPGSVREATGEFYKNVGTIEDAGEGPYGRGDERILPAAGSWSKLQRYEWTYLLQNHGWKGSIPLMNFIEGMWTARGDTFSAPNPNVTALRTYLNANVDVDTELTSMAVLNWGCPWDDTTQNHFLWRRASGKWAHVPWDFDGYFGNGDNTGSGSSVYLGEHGLASVFPGNNFRGPNFLKDSIIKAFRTEYCERLWTLNNTYLHPDNLKQLTYRDQIGVAKSYYSFINGVKANFCEERFASVNTQCGHAANGSDFGRPIKPVNQFPSNNTAAVPPTNLTASAYAHSSGSSTGNAAHARSRWEMRSAGGTYDAPVWVLDSTASLTQAVAPFADLTFAQTYYWRVTYFDALGHPSFTSDETAFTFGPAPSTLTVIPVNATWKYTYTASFSDNSWTFPGFDDSVWSSGPGSLNFESPAPSGNWAQGTALPDPRTLTPAGRAYYFRTQFNFPGNPATATIRLRHFIDDGCVIWLNGVRIQRYYMNDLASYTSAGFSNGGPGEAVEQLASAITGTSVFDYVDPRTVLVQGLNTMAVEVHQSSGASSDIVFGLKMEADLVSNGGEVAINEIMANNRNAVANGNSYPDYIELRNNTAAAANLNGWSLSDDVLLPNKFVFPATTSIPAGGRLLIWCDSDSVAPGLHAGFKLAAEGQTVVLFQGTNVRDYLTFGPQAENLPIGRVADGTGSWTLISPSPMSANAAVTLGSVSQLKINEWMAAPRAGEDWFELYNTGASPVALGGLFLSDTPGSPQITQIPALSYIAGGGFTLFEASGSSAGRNQCNFKLSTSGDSLILTAANGATQLDAVSFSSQSVGVSQGRRPDGGPAMVTFPAPADAVASWQKCPTPTPSAANFTTSAVIISEALTNSQLPQIDYVELHNPTAEPVDVSGWWLSDDRADRNKFVVPAGTIIPAGGYFLIDETQFNSGPKAFSLSSMGDEIVFTAISGGVATGFGDQVTFGAAAQDTAFRRVLTANPTNNWSLEFWPATAITPAAANAAPQTFPVIVNEIMYHPPDLAATDNTRDEFIELHNATTTAVDLSGWTLKGDADFVFPSGASLRPGDYILVTGFSPDTDAASLSAFRANYGLSADTPVFGPFTPKLSNSTGRLELARPGAGIGNPGALVLADKVEYFDGVPWPAAADGTGSSLQRLGRAVIGNDPANWIGYAPTPGAVNSGETVIADNDGDGIDNAWESANGLDPFSAADATGDLDGDGSDNRAEFVADTDPRDRLNVFRASAAPIQGGFQISFPIRPGKTYSILYTDNLAEGSWQRLVDIPPSQIPGTAVRQDLTPVARRFYRVVTPQQP